MKAAAANTQEITFFLPLLYEVAKKRHYQLRMAGINHISTDELVNAGYLGLNEAWVSFLPERGVPFAGYAKYKISLAISQFLRDLDLVPKETRAALKKLRETVDQLTAKLQRPPTEEEVAAAMGITLEALWQLKASNIFEESLEREDSAEGESLAPIDIIPAETSPPSLETDPKVLADKTNQCIKRLLTAQQTLILLLMDSRGFSAREVAELIKEEEVDANAVYYQRNLARKEIASCLRKKGYSIIDIA